MFDLITCNDVLQHVSSKDEHVLREFYRVLSTDGLVYLRTNAVQRFNATDDVAEDYHRYTKNEIIQKATTIGFKVLRATYANSIPSLAADFKNFLRNKKEKHHHPKDEHAYSGLVMQIPPAPINTLLSWFMKREARVLTAASSSLTFGHSLIFLLKKSAVQ